MPYRGSADEAVRGGDSTHRSEFADGEVFRLFNGIVRRVNDQGHHAEVLSAKSEDMLRGGQMRCELRLVWKGSRSSALTPPA